MVIMPRIIEGKFDSAPEDQVIDKCGLDEISFVNFLLRFWGELGA